MKQLHHQITGPFFVALKLLFYGISTKERLDLRQWFSFKLKLFDNITPFGHFENQITLTIYF